MAHSAQSPVMLSGSRLVIYVNSVILAYAQSLSFSDRMAVAPVGGIGSYSYDALEPLQYSASGSLVITEYSKAAYDAITAIGNKATKPDRVSATASNNTMLQSGWFSPVAMMISNTFDIDVYSRVTQDSLTNLTKRYTLQNCRFNSYALTFTPGSLVQETLGYLCLAIIDEQYEDSSAQA